VTLLPLLFALQGAAAPQPDSATYANPGVRAIVERAAELNHRVPAGLGAYRVNVESEISLSIRRREGPEIEGSIEQVASEVRWDRTGAAEQRVGGYRSQQVGPTFSALSYVNNAWVVPSLYGNRLALLFGRDTSTRRAPTDTTRPRTYAVHPLADDRESTYRYSGGDTIHTIRYLEREIRIVRVMVTPKDDLQRRTTVFEGEMDLDADRYHVVRLRGSFSTMNPGNANRGELGLAGVRGVIYVELVNSEVESQWWLPASQRFESQISSTLFGEARAIFRILSRFGPFDITPPVDSVAAVDTLRARPHRLTYAPTDSLGRYRAWVQPIGEATSVVSAADFDDIAPDVFSFSGPPQLLFQPERIHDLLHVNRVEGPFTGVAATLRLRDAAPGVLLRGVAGYGWSDQTVRWRGIVERRRGPTFLSLRAGRQLDLTNKFHNGLDSASAIVTFFGDDAFDYVDRRLVSAQVARTLSEKYGTQVRFDVGLVEDRSVVTNYEGFPFSDVRENRAVTEGRYTRTGLALDWRPNVNGEFLRPGLGARLRYERGDGDVIDYQRVDGLIGMRVPRGRFVFAARLDAGAVISDAPPPQQLFELGAYQGLEGYDVNAFAGDRAALVRTLAMYQLPVWRSPLRLGRMWLPAPAPAFSVGLHAGWTEASSAAAQNAITARGETCSGTAPVVCVPVARESEGWRSTFVVGLRFFGGVAAIGVAKPLDGRDWRGVIRVGGQL
jgi:hypothetical protein